MTQPFRKFGLLLHVVLSVGWIGTVLAFLTLASASFLGDPAISRAAYLSMAVVGRGALLPLSVGALVSGIIQSLGTKWGLLRHYWVLVKFVLTLFAAAALFVHQATAISEVARLATSASADLLQSRRLHDLGVQLRADSALALVVLLIIAAIAIYKPWGVVGYVTRSLRIFLAAVVALVLAFIALHLSGHSPHRHSH